MSRDLPLLVVVTGPPASGKTTVARGLAEALRLPLLEKDTIKEALFDSLGSADVEWSQRLGAATMTVLFALLGQTLRAGSGAVAEANFVRGESEPGFRRLPPARLVQVHCAAPLELLEARYRSRERHPGHVDAERLPALRLAVETGRHDPLDLAAETIRLDTSAAVDLASVLVRIGRE